MVGYLLSVFIAEIIIPCTGRAQTQGAQPRVLVCSFKHLTLERGVKKSNSFLPRNRTSRIVSQCLSMKYEFFNSGHGANGITPSLPVHRIGRMAFLPPRLRNHLGMLVFICQTIRMMVSRLRMLVVLTFNTRPCACACAFPRAAKWFSPPCHITLKIA